MGKFYEAIPQNLAQWIEDQQMFWVASAPLGGEGHVNLSPKGLRGSFHIENANRVWYEDLTGSGSETMAHLREPGNGRITIMFCAFEGPPRIVRLFGRGTVYEFGTPEYDTLLSPEKRRPGSRSVIVIDVHKVGSSCGYGVPRYTFTTHRPTLLDWCATLEASDQKFASAHPSAGSGEIAEKGLKAYWVKENLKSIDGLPAMQAAHVSAVTPVHAPPDGEWGKEVKAQTKTSVQVKGGEVQRAEMMKLVAAFSMGIVVSAVYVKLAGVV